MKPPPCAVDIMVVCRPESFLNRESHSNRQSYSSKVKSNLCFGWAFSMCCKKQGCFHYSFVSVFGYHYYVYLFSAFTTTKHHKNAKCPKEPTSNIFRQISTNATTLRICVLTTLLALTHLVLMSASVLMGSLEMGWTVLVGQATRRLGFSFTCVC